MNKVRDLLVFATNHLQHLESSSLDSEVLLSYVLNKPREHLLAHGEDQVPSEKAGEFHELITRRAKHEPVAYLTNQKEFYGQTFFMDKRVHIPRPSTEDLIDCIKEFVSMDFNGTMADIGTGSGCIAITMALEFPQAKIIATDISEDALAVAKSNANTNPARAHKGAGFPISAGRVRLAFKQGNLLEPLTEPVDVIVSNPPYGWANDWSDDEEIKYQPKISYESGEDGLDAIREIIDKLPEYLNPKGRAFIEFDPRQAQKIKNLASSRGLRGEIRKDSAGFERILILANYT